MCSASEEDEDDEGKRSVVRWSCCSPCSSSVSRSERGVTLLVLAMDEEEDEWEWDGEGGGRVNCAWGRGGEDADADVEAAAVIRVLGRKGIRDEDGRWICVVFVSLDEVDCVLLAVLVLDRSPRIRRGGEDAVKVVMSGVF